MRLTARSVFTLGLLTLSLACWRTGRRAAPDSTRETTVRVENRSWSEMTIYVVRSGQRIRLGTVSGTSTQKLVIPASLVFGATPLSFIADPIGSSRRATSWELTVHPGDEVTLIIPNY